MKKIKHIWFDFSDTMVFLNDEIHDKLRYETYSSVVKKLVTPELIDEYEALYKKHKSNSAVFASLGFDSGYWSSKIATIDQKILLRLAEDDIPNVLSELKEVVPISLFSNIHTEKILPALRINPKWFTYILNPNIVKRPKPAPDGFQLVIERSELPPENILFVGDSVEKEMIPAGKLGIVTCLMWSSSERADYSFSSFKEILNLVK